MSNYNNVFCIKYVVSVKNKNGNTLYGPFDDISEANQWINKTMFSLLDYLNTEIIEVFTPKNDEK